MKSPRNHERTCVACADGLHHSTPCDCKESLPLSSSAPSYFQEAIMLPRAAWALRHHHHHHHLLLLLSPPARTSKKERPGEL
ncbi:hypothetical protein BRADI_5g12655v3 [Brachypodium distachyon]|uniref:Uncharacterized protein n=1 Tax=Brachypodium distachyon TaxID=15368 RepID=A0A0Q3E597_BRADI|nr:hypothetical protein BRADI_5g12655v3 [Brachypodium distachyon]